MKNFTNNFKQFTSRLSARWLIMALMLLVGTSSAWADGFFDGLKVGYYSGTGVGDIWTDYNTSDIGTLSGQPYLKGVSVKTWGDNVTSVSIEIKNGNTTLLSATNATKKSEWNNGNQVNWNKEWELLTNIALPKTSGAHAISVIAKTNNGTTVTYTLTYSIPCDNVDDSQIRIEIASATSYTKVYAWYDSNSELLGGWSGTVMTTDGTSLINGQTVKYITISRNSVSLEKSVNIIFNNGNGSKTGDITGLKWGNIYYFDKNGGIMESKCLEPACTTPKDSHFTYTAPSDLTYNGSAKEASVTWKSGTGSGTITKYYKSGTGSYTTTAPTNVGTYTVAVKTTAAGDYCATEDYVEVGSFTINCLKPADSNFTYTAPSNLVYNGSAKEATVTWKSGTGSGTITKYYKSGSNSYTTTAPTAIGTYIVAVKTVEAGNYCATEDYVEVGSFTIVCAQPVKDNFTYTAPSNLTYNGSAKEASVTWKSGTGSGTITKYYKSGTGSYTTTAPTAIGTYIVAVKTVEAGNYCATEDYVEVGSFTIVCAQPIKDNFTYTAPSELTYNGSAKEATVTWIPGTGSGDITVYYKSGTGSYSSAKPTEAGTYTVAVKTVEAGNYCATEDYVEVGVFEITKINQTALNITNLNTNVCGTTVTVVAEGGSGTGAITYAITADNTDTRDASINPNTGVVTVKSAGSVTVTASKAGDNNYNVATPVSKTFSFTMPIENVELAIIEGKSATGKYCVGHQIKFQLTYTGSTPTFDTEHFSWILDNFESEISNNDGGIASGATWTTTLSANDTSLKLKLKDCNGTWKESTPITFEVYERPSAPVFNPNSITVCQGQQFTLPGSEAEGYIWSDATGKPTTPNKPNGIDATAEYYAVISFGCPSDATLYTVNVNKIPTITGASVAQTNKEITLESAAGADTEWSVSPTENVTLTDNGDGTATFVATANGDYTITASNGVCAPVSHTIKVSDAFYIWVRNAKEGETAYANFYFPDQNTEDVRGGEMFYAECDERPTASNYKEYNKGGREADLVHTDCDGYTWYGFKASDEVIAGTKYFYVHATNNINDGGYYTHTVPAKEALTADLYYTLGTNGNSYWGWNIVKASAPYAGPMVHASGSTALGTDKFVALYVTDCSGKEIESYQWYKGDDVYSSSCNYVTKDGTVPGDAGQTNNIRPTVAGNYSCKVTYKDGSSITSAAVPVTGTYSNSFTSNIPVIVVNTNGVGFPDCANSDKGHTPSAQTDYYKAKRSVDVKIYDGTSVIYDRKARMNYRGSSSLNFDKKSYAFCPGAANCVSDKGRKDYVKTEKQNMLGVGEAVDKDWVLYAAAADPSLIRNRLVFDAYKTMTGQWGVSSCYVEVIVDGEYKGVYVFMDKITNNKKRVNITHADGFIVKFDKTDREDRFGGYNNKLGDEKTFKTTRTGKDDIDTYDTTIDQRFEIEYPEKDDFKTTWNSKVGKIQQLFEDFETALADGDYQTVQKYIDYNSWADWFIINEYTKNVDAYRASCLFVYNGDKIEARPLWDQELSFNNTCPNYMGDYGSNDATGFLIKKDKVYNGDFKAPFWFTGGGTNITGGLLNDPCFVQIVKEKWNEYSAEGGILTEAKLAAKISEYETELGTDAASREANFWKSHSRSSISSGCYTGKEGTGYNNTDVTTSKSTMETWIKNRGNGLTTAINSLTGAAFSIQIVPTMIETTPWEPAHIAVNVTPEGYDYTLEYTDNNLKGVANVIIEESGNEITYRIPRPADWEAGDEDEEGERTDIEYGIRATLSVADGTTQCGSQAAPTSTAKIILQDEENEKCPEQ